MRVKKRNGIFQEVSFDKVIQRLKCLCIIEPKLNIDVTEIAQKVCARIYDKVSTVELDELAAEQCTQKGVLNLEYGILASRIIISNNHKITSPSFSETVYLLYNNKDVNDQPYPLISDELFEFVIKNKNKLNDYIDYSRDFGFDYFGYKTLEKAYLMKINLHKYLNMLILCLDQMIFMVQLQVCHLRSTKTNQERRTG